MPQVISPVQLMGQTVMMSECVPGCILQHVVLIFGDVSKINQESNRLISGKFTPASCPIASASSVLDAYCTQFQCWFKLLLNLMFCLIMLVEGNVGITSIKCMMCSVFRGFQYVLLMTDQWQWISSVTNNLLPVDSMEDDTGHFFAAFCKFVQTLVHDNRVACVPVRGELKHVIRGVS